MRSFVLVAATASGIIWSVTNKGVRKLMARGIVASVLGVFLFACAGCGGRSTSTQDSSTFESVAAAKPEAQPVSKDPSQPVSIAPIGNGLYAVADYHTVRIWNSASNSFSTPNLAKPEVFDQKIPSDIVNHWNPTGVYFYNNILYVANYNFHDVLTFKISDDASVLVLNSVITDPAMVSPENTFVTSRGVAVADYDASGVFFFSLDGAPRWKDTSLSEAHGVAMDGSYVYVTSLSGDNKFRRYTLDGQSVATNADFSDLLYPTQVTVSYDGKGGEQITIIDANRGTISTYGDDLTKVNQIGHLGPDMFDRPYGFAEANGGFIVADTKNHRLVSLTGSGQLVSNAPLAKVTELGTWSTWGNRYAYCSNSKLSSPVFSAQFDQYIGFDIICTQTSGAMYSQILLPHGRTTPNHLFNRPDPDFNFAWQGNLTVDGQTYWLIGSPTINVIMISLNGNYVFATHDPSISIWGVSGAESYLANVVRQAQPALTRYQKMSQQCSPLYAFLDAGVATHADSLDQQLDGVVEYPNAKQYVDQWLLGSPMPANITQSLITSGQTAFDDLKLLSLLSQTTAAKERQAWEACHQ